MLWFVIWIFASHETPAAHPSISDGERRYIERAIGKNDIALIPKVRIYFA